jgi:hypothetical protein
VILEDVPSAAVGLLAVYFFWRWLKKPEMLAAFIAGIILGFAELSKFTLLIFYPLFILIWVLYRLPELRTLSRRDFVAQIGQLVLLFAMSILIINMGYLFEDTGKQLGKFNFQTTLFTGCENLKDVPPSGRNRFENTLLGKIPVPLPANFIQGIDTQRFDFERGLPSYLRGEWSQHGWWYYYLYALLLKLPLGVILLFGVAIYCTLFVREVNVSWRDEMVLILPGVVLLIFVSSQTGFSIHSRYVIPALPFFFIWISKVGKLFLPQVPRSFKKRVLSIIVSILLAWSVMSSLSIYPHSISYFNELAAIIPTPREPRCPSEPRDSSFIVSIIGAGSRNGGRHLHDSNIDWGQDIFYLEKWCKNHPEVTSIHVFCFSSFPLDQTTIPLGKSNSEIDKLTGYIAISTNNLYDKENKFRRFLDIQPIARIGYSIYIYRVDE